MSIGPINPVGTPPIASGVIRGAQGASEGTRPQVEEKAPTESATVESVTEEKSEMSTKNFVSLSQQVHAPKKSELNGMDGVMDMEKMVQMVMALKLLEKVIEAVSKILEGVLGGNKPR